MVNLGAKISEARRAQNLTQRKLADELDVHWNTVARWERNEVECRMDQLYKIAQVTQKPLSWFLDLESKEGGKVYVTIDPLKFRLARERNDHSVKEVSVLLEMPEQLIQEIEEQPTKIEMEYIHRMVFVLGYTCSWFFTVESNKKWTEDDEIYDRWLETGREKWKFKEHFYLLWEQNRMHPKMNYEDLATWLKTFSQWQIFYSKPPKTPEEINTIENLKTLSTKSAECVKSEVNYFLAREKDKARMKEEDRSNYNEASAIIQNPLEKS